jgi:hypothetical protein
MLLVGQPSGRPRVLLMLAGWVVNLAVTEWALRRRPARPIRSLLSPRRAGTPVAADRLG